MLLEKWLSTTIKLSVIYVDGIFAKTRAAPIYFHTYLVITLL